ncbi:AMP-binding protein [Streptomyces sp. 1331.2]|uniref:AMP-binding protein n=1 Tax=Streptomyces sp. 1331.2 TaxID=1938835 RepID=UPI000BD9922E|nr:AMP-binding protein [Streptomyces sp. 1331.2]SOB85976.1 fatty-acyl-CoA synthase [Streptomyces sp. 1331.2]
MAGAGPTYTGLVLEGLARDPGRVAIRSGSDALTGQDCLDAVHRLARALERAGLGRGDGVTVLAGNRPEALLVRLAANLLGCRVAMPYPDAPPAEQVALTEFAGTDALVFDPRRCSAAAAGIAHALPGAVLFALGPAPFGLGTDLLETAADCSPAAFEPQYRPEDVMAVRFTGGTTGRPKGVLRRFARPPRPALLSASTFLLCTPLCHGGGSSADLALAAGGTVVLQDGFDAGAVLAAVERYRVTRTYLPPHLLYRLLDHPLLSATDTGSLRRVGYTGCPPSPRRLAEATRRLGRVLHQTYSLTECGPVARLSPDEHLDPRLLTTAGRPYPDTGVRVLDGDGTELPPGRTGELWVRTPTAMAGYWRDPELTARVLRDGWLDTGDLGSLDAAGYLTVAGRRDPMAIVEGHNVFPREIEEPLRTHPDVREAVMFTTADPDRLERVHAAVALAPGSRTTAEQLRRWSREHGHARCTPDTVLLLPAIPLTGLGKPDVAVLRALVAAAEAGRADGGTGRAPAIAGARDGV